jgi:hypothetical protein
MYGNVLGATSTVAGVAVLPATGNNRPLFYVAATLFAGGLITFAVSALAARKQRG